MVPGSCAAGVGPVLLCIPVPSPTGMEGWAGRWGEAVQRQKLYQAVTKPVGKPS